MTSVSSGIDPIPWVIGLGVAFSTMVPMMATLLTKMIIASRRRQYAESWMCALAVAFLCGGFQSVLSAGLDQWLYKALVWVVLLVLIAGATVYRHVKEEFLWWRFKRLAWRAPLPMPTSNKSST